MLYRRRAPRPEHLLSRQGRYYRAIREMIFAALGRVCKKCGSTVDLEFDIVTPVGGPKSHHEGMSSCARAAFYKRQHAVKNVQILCSLCNSSKGNRLENENRPLTEAPAGGNLTMSQ